MNDRLRVGVVGVGHFGRHHARIYAELPDVDLIGVVDRDVERARAVAETCDTDVFSDGADLLGRVDAVSVAVPTRDHAEVACAFLENDVSVLVEKPMAATLEEARRIRDAAAASNAQLQVGHVMRFSPIVLAMRELDVEPRFIEVHRLSPFSFRSLDVGVVLDMMIHDIDLLLELVRGRVEKVDAVGCAIVGESEDICNARIVFDNGCVANLTASRAALKTMRKLRVFSPQGYISADFVANDALIIHKAGEWSPGSVDVERFKALPLEEIVKVMTDRFFKVRQLKLDEVEPLRAELEAFLACVRSGDTPIVSGDDGVRSMETAEQILSAVKAHYWYR